MPVFDTIKQFFLLLLIILITPTIFRSIKHQYSALIEGRSQVAVLAIQGTVQDANYYIQRLNEYFDDGSIKAILLTINCPETTAGAAEAIYTEIESLKRRNPKPVIGLIENVCTGGGYWIACASDYLIAPGTCLVGAISGAFKHAAGIIEQDSARLKEINQDNYQQFVHAVARSRKLSLSKIDQWADGKLFNGQQAQRLHLVDAIGSPDLAATIIKQKALIEGEIEWIHPHTNWLLGLIKLWQGENNRMIIATTDLIQTKD